MSRFCRNALIIMAILLSSCDGNPVGEVQTTATSANYMTVSTAETPSSAFSEKTPTLEQEIHYGVVRVPTKIDEMVNELKNLSIADFFEHSFIFWLSRDPESITILGISDQLGTRNNRLTNISESYIVDTEKLETAILNLLHTYNRDELSLADQLNYDIYEWFWLDRVEGHNFRLYNFPIQSYAASSVPDRLIYLLLNYQSIESKNDIEDYISRINLIDEKISQLIQEMELRELRGIRPPRAVLLDPINRYQNYLQRSSQNQYKITDNVLYQNLEAKLLKIDSLDDSVKQDYLNRTALAIETSFIPAYSDLIIYLRGLLERSGDDVGAWAYSQDSGYYQYLIQHYTSVNLTPEQVATLGELELVEDKKLLEEKALPEINTPLSEETNKNPLVNNWDNDYYSIGENLISQEYQKEYQKILSSSRLSLTNIFNYATTTYDRKIDDNSSPPIWLASDPAIVFFNDPWIFGFTDPNDGIIKIPKAALRTKIYSDDIPGLSFYLENSLSDETMPLFRQVLTFSGYLEGWMGYAIDLMKSQREFSNPEEEYFQIQRDTIISACMVIDSGIHYRGWTIGESSNYLEDSAGFKRGSLRTTVERMVVTPGQVLSYKIGQLKFNEMRNYAESELGDNFSLKNYHEWIISLGNMPLSVLEKQVQDYVIQQQKINSPNELP